MKFHNRSAVDLRIDSVVSFLNKRLFIRCAAIHLTYAAELQLSAGYRIERELHFGYSYALYQPELPL